MSENSEIAIACDLNALTPAERERRRLLAARFGRATIARKELAHGFELRLDPAAADLPALAEWIALEHRCCPFLYFRIEVEPTGGGIILALTGRSGVKEFLRERINSSSGA